jgi:hypothetical protein
VARGLEVLSPLAARLVRTGRSGRAARRATVTDLKRELQQRSTKSQRR